MWYFRDSDWSNNSDTLSNLMWHDVLLDLLLGMDLIGVKQKLRLCSCNAIGELKV